MNQKAYLKMHRREAMRAGFAIGAGFLGSNVALADDAAGKNGIAEIQMKSSRLDELRQFYEEKLQLPVNLETDKLTVDAGTTRLIFSPPEDAGAEPFYHFAFNIPEDKIEKALQWQKALTPVLLQGGKKEIIHFSGINAHSVYFNDPAGNIVEYIARHNLKNSAQGDFSPDDILYASEIGLVVDDVTQTERDVKDVLGRNYPNEYKPKSFSAVGDDYARLILVKRDRKWFPNKKQAAKVHPVQATIHGEKDAKLENNEFDFKVNFARPS